MGYGIVPGVFGFVGVVWTLVKLLPEVDLHGVNWHRHKHILAFISGPNHVTIRDYEDSERKEPCILTHESQRDVKLLEWRPNGGRTLSVACKQVSRHFCILIVQLAQCFVYYDFKKIYQQLCYFLLGIFSITELSRGRICIWTASYPANAASVRSGVTSGTIARGAGTRWTLVDFLRSHDDEQISALSWSPDGRYPNYTFSNSSTYWSFYIPALSDCPPLRYNSRLLKATFEGAPVFQIDGKCSLDPPEINEKSGLGLSFTPIADQVRDEEIFDLGLLSSSHLGQGGDLVEDSPLGKKQPSCMLNHDGSNPVQMGISVTGSDLGLCRVKETMGIFDRVNDCIQTTTQVDDRDEGNDSRRQEDVEIGADLVPTKLVGLNPNEIQLGLADVVDRSTGQFLRVERHTGVNDLVEDEDVAIEFLPDVDRMVHEVEGDICDPQGVLQALEEYGSLDSSNESLGPNEENEDYSEEERANDVELNLTGLYHEEEVGGSIDRDNMNSSLHPHIQSSHSVSVRGVGQEGESVLGPCFLQVSGKLLETLGLALVRNTGKKSRAKRVGIPSGGDRNHRGSGLRKGLRELRNLTSAQIPLDMLWHSTRVWHMALSHGENDEHALVACKGATWDPDGGMILVAFSESLTLGSVHFASKPPSLDAHLLPVDLSEIQSLTHSRGIEKIAWDASGDRLALSYKDGDELYRGLIAICDVKRTPLISASLIGFIRGPGDNPRPLAFSFHDKFKQGPLLTVQVVYHIPDPVPHTGMIHILGGEDILTFFLFSLFHHLRSLSTASYPPASSSL
ncbi:hypothetical protein TEA_021814 [Camellia sinensis var. sinensis]|uniref:Uncharacterized protein n=1 Tax=Camellia sinensis var. sinensis TaxID=542762 RepID=A0A4S4D922_CAMSN|nr:hypothetical protein TEA_021814 [Camellia sinensis var. sinensis]